MPSPPETTASGSSVPDPLSATPGRVKPISLEQLIALNDEIVSLVRVGVPLELGLRETGRDLRGTVGDISVRLAARLSRGESLPEALAAHEEHFPPAYRAVVEAGIKAGQLASALESLSTISRQIVDLRRRIGVALLYPLIVLAVAYTLFLTFLSVMIGRFAQAFESFHLTMHPALRFLVSMEENMGVWAWIPPVVLLALLSWWALTGGAKSLNFTGLATPLGWIPGVRRLSTNFRWASFSDLLALLVEHQVPMPEGIVLASAATCGPEIQASSRNLAAAMTRGEAWPGSAAAGKTVGGGIQAAPFPAFLRWLITHGQEQGRLAPALRQAGEMYRRRALMQVDWLRLAFPVLTAILIGGGATLAYGLVLFLPLTDFLRGLAEL